MTPIPKERVEELRDGHQAQADYFAEAERVAVDPGSKAACAEQGATAGDTTACLRELLAARAAITRAIEGFRVDVETNSAAEAVDLLSMRLWERLWDLLDHHLGRGQ